MALKIPVLDHYEWQKSVKDKDLSTPPTTPQVGDRYIIGYNPTGAWHNRPKRIAECVSLDPIQWDLTEPREGMLTLVSDEGILYQYVSAKWKDFALIVGRRRVEPQNSSKSLTIDDCGKVFTADSTSMVTFTLPSVGQTDTGIHYTFSRVNSAGSLVIQAADSDMIADSGPGGTIYSDDPEENCTSITILLAKQNHWIITSGHGTWGTTD